MAQQGGTGHANPDIFQTINLKASTAQIVLDSTSANTTTLQDAATAARVITFPDATDTLTGNTATQTLTNKSITSPTITGSPSAGTATWSNLGSVTTIDINGGTIDGVTIGGTTPTAGTFTTVTTSGQAGHAFGPFGASAGNTGESRFLELAANGTNYVGFKAADSIAANVIWTLPAADGTAGQQLTTDGAGILSWAASSSGAPANASYVVLGLNGTLTDERVLTGTANQIVITDGGAGTTVTLSTPQDIATSSSPTFAGLTLTGTAKFTPSSNQSLSAASAISANATTVQVSGSGGAVTLTSTPTIANGTDGQIIYIVGTDDTNTVTIQDQANLASSNVQLSGGNNFTLGLGDILHLMFSSTVGDWIEISRTDN